MLVWIENAPKFAENDEEEVIEYIDKVASCSSKVPTSDNQKYVEYQKHKHSRTCRKGGKPVCRFGIPFPPMRKTTIVCPYDGDEREVHEENYVKVK